MGPFAVADPYTPKDFNQAARTLLALFTTAYDVDLINHPPRTISLSYSLADPTPQPAPRPGVLRHCNLTLPYGVRPRDPDPETLQKALRVLYQVFRPVGIAKLYSNGLNPSRLSGHPTVVPRQRRIRITPSNEPAATLRLKRTLKAQARLRQDQRQLIELLHQHNIEADFISAVRQAAPAVSAAYRG
jgi:hypothetical protein